MLVNFLFKVTILIAFSCLVNSYRYDIGKLNIDLKIILILK